MNVLATLRRREQNGFTLMELMVTLSVFALMMTLLMQMVTTATKTSNNGFKHMDADTQARLVLDRIANDIGKMVNRPDVDYYFEKHTGNDQLAFFSEASGYYPDNTTLAQGDTASLVGYRINSKFQLERLSKGLVWNGAGGVGDSMVYLPQTISQTWPLVVDQGNDPDYQVIGSQVFRFEYCFLLHNSAKETDPPKLSNVPYYGGGPYPRNKRVDRCFGHHNIHRCLGRPESNWTGRRCPIEGCGKTVRH